MIAQIGDLTTITSMPVGAQLVIEHNNDANLIGVDSLISALLADALWVGTQTEYNELGTYNSSTLYVIVEIVQQGSSFMPDVTVTDMIYGNSYAPRKVVRGYLGTLCIFDRVNWDYEKGETSFPGTIDQIEDTEIRPFSTENVNRDWELEVSFTIDATEDTEYLGVMCCNTSSRSSFYNPSLLVDFLHSEQYGNSVTVQVTPGLSYGGSASENGYPTTLKISHNFSDKTFTLYHKYYYNGQWNESTTTSTPYVSMGTTTIPLILGGLYNSTPAVEEEYSESNLFTGTLNYMKFRYTSEPQIQWLLNIENYVCDGTATTWARTGIPIFSSENINRDWEFLIKATPDDPTVTAENKTTIGIIGRAASDTSGSAYYIEVGVRPTGVYLFHGGSVSGTHNQVFACDSTKPIRVVKSGTAINFYVDDVLINTFTMTNTTGGTYSEIEFGGWYRGSGYYYFKGTIDYFRFRFTS